MTAVDATVSPQTLSQFDLFSEEHQTIKWELFALGRSECPVAHIEPQGGMWLITQYDDVRRVLEDWETFSSLESPIVPAGIKLCPIDNDPPIQTAARQLLNSLFSRGALAKFEAPMRAAAKELIGNWIDRGSVELLSEYAGPYVGKVLAQVVFDDLSADELERASDIALRVAEGATPAVYLELMGMCQEYLARARTNGVTGDGVVARLITGEFDGRPVSEEEQLGALAILLLGGLDTTRAAIGNIAYRVTQTAGLEDRLRDPRWVRRDLDEFLRLDSPVAAMARVATRDVELHGITIKAGERVQVRFDSANRDATRFHDPETLVFDEARSGHAAFGFGVHRCIGSNMARLQIEIAFDELLSQVTNLRLAPQAHVQWVAGQSNALHAVNLVFDKRQ